MSWPSLQWSPPGEISEDGCWVIWHREFMYIASSRLGVLWQFLTEYGHDRHMIG